MFQRRQASGNESVGEPNKNHVIKEVVYPILPSHTGTFLTPPRGKRKTPTLKAKKYNYILVYEIYVL